MQTLALLVYLNYLNIFLKGLHLENSLASPLGSGNDNLCNPDFKKDPVCLQFITLTQFHEDIP